MKKVLSIPYDLVGACFVAFFLLTSPAMAQVLFEDNFSKPGRSEEKWAFLQGGWEVQGGALSQKQANGRTIAVISDDFWDDTWNEYIFEVTAKKLRGGNGVRIFWRINDDMQPGPGRDDARSFTLDGPVKGRLADEKSGLSFGGRSVGKIRPRLSSGTLEELPASKMELRQSTSWEMSRCMSKL